MLRRRRGGTRGIPVFLSVLSGLKGVEAVGGMLGRPHHQVCLAGMGPQRVGQLVVRFSGAGFPQAAFLGRVRAEQVCPTLHGDIVLFRKFVDALKADIAPRSNVVVPHDHVHGIGVVRMAVGRRLGGHGITSESGAVREQLRSSGEKILASRTPNGLAEGTVLPDCQYGRNPRRRRESRHGQSRRDGGRHPGHPARRSGAGRRRA